MGGIMKWWRLERRVPTFAWHIHHDRLVGPLTEPIEDRIAYIKEAKPQEEIALRLRLLAPVKGRLPSTFVKAWVVFVQTLDRFNKAFPVYDKNRLAYDKAKSARDKAWAAYAKALADHLPEFEILHAKECPNCPWDGNTIFPERDSQ